MKSSSLPIACLFLLLTLFSQPVKAQDVAPLVTSQLAGPVYLPLVVVSSSAAPSSTIVVDHRHTDIHQIPAYWLDQAKKLAVHYAHTSHGSQVLSGLEWLEGRDPQYNVDIQASGTTVLPPDSTALRIYDGNNYPGNTYITPDMFWESNDGLDHTRSVAATGWFDLSLWTWCGQMSYYSDTQVQQYIDALEQLAAENPDVTYIYYTGHTDGTAPGGDLWRHNDMVRQHTQQSGGILFDFADIESYDPAGVFHPSVSDACEWCADWCTQHPGSFECQSLPSCAHTHGLQCTLKAQAFWYLMARLAGWDGN
jgi:hypothetical protein